MKIGIFNHWLYRRVQKGMLICVTAVIFLQRLFLFVYFELEAFLTQEVTVKLSKICKPYI